MIYENDESELMTHQQSLIMHNPNHHLNENHHNDE